MSLAISISTPPFDDSESIVRGSTDATKQVRIEADGLTTGTVRVITMPDQDVDLTPGTDFAAAPLFGVNTATQSFVSTAALADVTGLSVSLEANKSYRVKANLWLFVGGGGIKAALNGPAGFTSIHYAVQIVRTGGIDTVGLHTAYDSSTGQADATVIVAEIDAIIINGGTAGTLVVRAAQQVSNGASSDILRDSFLRVEEAA